MCLIVVQPKTAPPMPRSEFGRAWSRNHDGGGLMYHQGGRVMYVKPLWREKQFWRSYKEAQKNAEGPVVLHFRLCSSGKVCAENTHPFITARERSVGVVHNGNLWAKPDYYWSDTRIWAESVFGEIPADKLLSRECEKEWDGRVGWSKFVFLAGDGRIAIWNEKSGFWRDGRWYSNSCADEPTKTVIVSGYGGYRPSPPSWQEQWESGRVSKEWEDNWPMRSAYEEETKSEPEVRKEIETAESLIQKTIEDHRYRGQQYHFGRNGKWGWHPKP